MRDLTKPQDHARSLGHRPDDSATAGPNTSWLLDDECLRTATKVASQARQPWAEGHNPLGLLKRAPTNFHRRKGNESASEHHRSHWRTVSQFGILQSCHHL